MPRLSSCLLLVALSAATSACGSSSAPPADAGAIIAADAGLPDAGTSTSACPSAAATSATATVAPSGCVVLSRDTSACEASRRAAGLSGHWLRFSCRVVLSKPSATEIVARADGLPDYRSNYFATSNACWESYTAATQNPNTLAAQSLELHFPASPDTTTQTMRGGVVGVALNGVPIFANTAAPGDDIFQEARTFDRCGAHPQMTGVYHYHGEPYAISYNDAAFIGVMRDGYAVYGRNDSGGTTPTLDASGGHSSTTADSPAAAVYHYHVNEQTSSTAGTVGERQFFLTKGSYRGTPGTCTGC